MRNLIESRCQLRSLFGSEAEGGGQNKPDCKFIDKLRGTIQQHHGDSDFSVEQLGGELGLSRVQLYRKVKAMTGQSPVEILREARLRRGDHREDRCRDSLRGGVLLAHLFHQMLQGFLRPPTQGGVWQCIMAAPQ